MLDDDGDDIHPLFHGAPATTEFRKLRKRIIRNVREAIEHYGMIGRDTRRAGTTSSTDAPWSPSCASSITVTERVATGPKGEAAR